MHFLGERAARLATRLQRGAFLRSRLTGAVQHGATSNRLNLFLGLLHLVLLEITSVSVEGHVRAAVTGTVLHLFNIKPGVSKPVRDADMPQMVWMTWEAQPAGQLRPVVGQCGAWHIASIASVYDIQGLRPAFIFLQFGQCALQDGKVSVTGFGLHGMDKLTLRISHRMRNAALYGEHTRVEAQLFPPSHNL